MTITFATSVWENDWEFLLKTDRLEQAIARCHYPFTEKVLFITNVRNRQQVSTHADQLVQRGIIDRFIFVDEYAQQALDSLNISQQSAAPGYYYSIADYVSIYCCRTEYLLQFKGDSMVEPDAPQDWLRRGIKLLETRPDIKVFNLCWNHMVDAARVESLSETGDCFLGYGFSDQMYLVRAQEFKQTIYDQDHPASSRYPSYGGRAFERRVDSWMRNNQFLRATFKHGSYLHKNFPKNLFKRKIMLAILKFRSRNGASQPE